MKGAQRKLERRGGTYKGIKSPIVVMERLKLKNTTERRKI